MARHYYEIGIGESLSQDWARGFPGFTLVDQPCGTALICGWVEDQTALHGVLARVRDLGLTLLSVQVVPLELTVSLEVGEGADG